MWGKDGKGGYGLAHILERREAQALEYPNITKDQAKDYALKIYRMIPEVLDKGEVRTDELKRITIEFNNHVVAVRDNWKGEKLDNKWVVTSFESKDNKGTATKYANAENYEEMVNRPSDLVTENNPTLKETISQEKPLSVLEKSQLEKEKKLESERLAKAEKERIQKIKDKEQAELNAKIREQKNATLGKSELDRQITKSDNIPYKELENAPKSSVSLNDNEIHPLKFVIVNKSDLKPNFNNTGTQTRTAIDSKKIEEIASNFDC